MRERSIAASFSLCSGKDTHQALHEGIGEAVTVPVSEDSIKMLEDRFCDAFHGSEQLVHACRAHGPGGPFLKTSPSPDESVRPVNFLQRQPHLIGLGRFEIE